MFDADSLKSKYSPTGPERVGFITKRGKVVEVENIHPQPTEFFEVHPTVVEENIAKSKAIWHTQPGRTSQLSYEDYLGFLNFPEQLHIVIGSDGYRIYRVENGSVLKEGIFAW